MAEIVLVAESVFRKTDAIFREVSDLDFQSAPAEEAELAGRIDATRCRLVILGSHRYRGGLYEALARSAAGRPALIARFGVGYDGIELDLCRRHRIFLTTTPGCQAQSVAELTLGLILALTRRIVEQDALLRTGRFQPQPGIELRGKRLGVIGFGDIGRRVAAAAHFGLGLNVIAVIRGSPAALQEKLGKPLEQIREEFGLEEISGEPEQVLPRCDVVSLHLRATPQTRHFLNAARLALLKPGALLINTARGSVLDETALYDALAAGHLAGAALDVFEREPYQPSSPEKDLRTLRNVVLLPHCGSFTAEAVSRMAQACLENIRHFLAADFDKLSRVV